MNGRSAARILTVITVVIVTFQFALILGAPWGRLTQGGYAEGSLPAAGRVFAAASMVILTLLALGVLGRAGLGPWASRPRLASACAWASLIYSALGMVINMVSPSAVERLVWVPVTVVMGVCAAIVLVQTRRRPKAK